MRTVEYELVQNIPLASHALVVFTKGFVSAKEAEQSPSFLNFLPILPIVFHEDTVKSLFRRRFLGGLENALIENRALFIGLQSRMEDMYGQTREALHFACSSKMLAYHKSDGSFSLVRRSGQPSIENPETRSILQTAERLGYWSGQVTFPEFMHKLSIQI